MTKRRSKRPTSKGKLKKIRLGNLKKTKSNVDSVLNDDNKIEHIDPVKRASLDRMYVVLIEISNRIWSEDQRMALEPRSDGSSHHPLEINSVLDAFSSEEKATEIQSAIWSTILRVSDVSNALNSSHMRDSDMSILSSASDI